MTNMAELLDCLVAAARDAGSCTAKLRRAESARESARAGDKRARQLELCKARKNAEHAEAALVRARRLVDDFALTIRCHMLQNGACLI